MPQVTWAAVIGSPIAHSLSPILHRAAWDSLGLPAAWEYYRHEVTARSVGDYLASLEPGLLGLSVTMPAKQAIIPLLDVIDPQAEAAGAVNTVIPSAGILTGFNTDVHGILAALTTCRQDAGLPIPEPHSLPSGSGATSPSAPTLRAVILGSGATASSALAALGSLGIDDVSVVARQCAGPGRIMMAAQRMGVTFTHIPWTHTSESVNALNQADIVISTVPASATGDLLSGLQPRSTSSLLDVVYSPWMTPLALAWANAGAHVVHGTEMLLHQAAMQVRLMTGKNPNLEVMREALRAAVGERA